MINGRIDGIKRSEGFTLLEVLIAMGIFSIAALGVLGLVTTSMTMTANSRQSQESNTIAQWLMEQFQSFPVNNANITGCTGGCWVYNNAGTITYNSSTVKSISMADLNGTTSSQYQVTWFTDSPTGTPKLRHYAIMVAWPRDRTVQGLAAGAPGFQDCAAGASCFRYTYHTYRTQ